MFEYFRLSISSVMANVVNRRPRHPDLKRLGSIGIREPFHFSPRSHTPLMVWVNRPASIASYWQDVERVGEEVQ